MQEPLRPKLIVGVTEFTQRLRYVFDQRLKALHDIGVTGEVTSYTVSENGNINFTLKQDQNTLVGFAWSRDAEKFPAVKLGMMVTAIGHVTIYPNRSCYQLTCVAIISSDERGRLSLLYADLKARFEAEGLFAATKKKPLPRYPRFIVVVSTSRGKGTDDFIDQMRRDAPYVRVQLQETRVQGSGAEFAIASAIAAADALRPDLIVVARGGGAYEELFTFNLEPVVRAIAAVATPIVTSIGHNADRHLADDVADAFFSTPSSAIKDIVASWVDGIRRLDEANSRIKRTVTNALRYKAQTLDGITNRLGSASRKARTDLEARMYALSQRLEKNSPATRLRLRQAAFAHLIGRLASWPHRAVAPFTRALAVSADRFEHANVRLTDARRGVISRLSVQLNSLDPSAPLARGYAILEHDGHPVLRADMLRTGDVVRAHLAHGALGLRVEEVDA